MSFRRIWAMILRYLYGTRDPGRITELLFWPAIDIGFLGLIAVWVGSSESNMPYVVEMIVSGLILWQLTYRSQYEISVNVMDEFWEQNLINLISTPLKNSEWIAAMTLGGLIKSIFTLAFGSLVGYIFFKVNILQLGWNLLPFAILCILSGWVIGFLAAGIIIYKGTRLAQLPWVVVALAGLFSAIYYPLSILPESLRLISQALPMSYIFEGMRQLLTTESLSSSYLVYSFILNIIYLFLSIRFFLYMFKMSRMKGLARLMS